MLFRTIKMQEGSYPDNRCHRKREVRLWISSNSLNLLIYKLTSPPWIVNVVIAFRDFHWIMRCTCGTEVLKETDLLNRTLHFWSYVNALFELNFQINRLYDSGVIDPSVVKYLTQELAAIASVGPGGLRKFFHHLLWNLTARGMLNYLCSSSKS